MSPRETIVAFQKVLQRRGPRGHGAQDARRRHRRRLRAARGAGQGPHEATARHAHRAGRHALADRLSDAPNHCRRASAVRGLAVVLAGCESTSSTKQVPVAVPQRPRRRRRSRKRPRPIARSCTPRSRRASTSAGKWTSRCRSSRCGEARSEERENLQRLRARLRDARARTRTRSRISNGRSSSRRTTRRSARTGAGTCARTAVPRTPFRSSSSPCAIRCTRLRTSR